MAVSYTHLDVYKRQIYNMNQKTDFNSSVVVVQPIDKGMVDMLNAQDDLYHVNLQGLDKGCLLYTSSG